MVHTVVNTGIDTLTNWHTSSSGDKRGSTNNHYKDWLNDMRVAFFESGDYGTDWAGAGSGVDVETTFPASPSDGVPFHRYNTNTSTFRYYIYSSVGWVSFDSSTISGAGSDSTAIHDNVLAEISAITNKATPVGGDYLIIEDSAASDAKKHITITNLEAILTHNNLAGIDSGDINHLTDAQITALHAIFVPGVVTAHSDVSNAGSGAIITSAERTALHPKYDSSDLETDLGLTVAQLLDVTVFGSANFAWIPMDFQHESQYGKATARVQAGDIGGTISNVSASDPVFFYKNMLPMTKGTLNLYIAGFELTLADADSSDYVFNVYVQTFSRSTTSSTVANISGSPFATDDGGASFNHAGYHTKTFTGINIGAFQDLMMWLNCSTATGDQLNVVGIKGKFYYA